jgi:hypothetical protein
MTALEGAVIEVATALESLSAPYMLIGGLAVAAWGEPRATLDVDVSVWAEPEQMEALLDGISRTLTPLVQDPRGFIEQTRVLPLQTRQGVRVDLIFASLPSEREAIHRAPVMEIAGHPTRVAAVEDLVLMKILSVRQKDLDDARRLLRRHRKTVDRSYLEPRLRELAEALGRPEILRLFRDAVA